MKNIFLFLLIAIFSTSVFAQNKLSSKSKKAINEYSKGLMYYNKVLLDDAINSFSKAIDHDLKFIEAYIMLGTIYEEKQDLKLAVDYYEKSLAIDPDFFPANLYQTAALEIRIGEYEKALKNYKTFLNRKDIKPATKMQVEHGIEICNFAIDQITNPKEFKPMSLGDGINTEYSEYMPALTADEETIIFTRLIKGGAAENISGYQEDFYISKLIDNEWQKAIPLSPKINSEGNEGAHTISPDGKTLYFTACNREGGKGKCDIYMSEWKKNGWDYPINLSEINSKAWDSQPSIAPDGKTMYFTSARAGSIDLYVTKLDENGRWSEPKPLPKNINTAGDDMSPFIHPDGKTLYFASNGHIGMGGLDIFYTKMNEDATWSDPINIGYPINTFRDEAFLFVSTSGEKAYFASGDLGGRNMDIYSFDLYKEARPTAVTYLKGTVIDDFTKQPLKASFELIDLKSSNIIAQSVSDDNGAFLLCIPTGRDYMLNVACSKYLFYSENFSLNGIHSKTAPFLKNIELQAIGTGEIVVLNNIFFDTDKFDLKEESFVELRKLNDYLIKNQQMKIEIRGHTDNTGTKQHNIELSKNRAKAVVDYLILQGIAENRIAYKGFGDTTPRSTNDTPEGRALNRRTEFKVLSL